MFNQIFFLIKRLINCNADKRKGFAYRIPSQGHFRIEVGCLFGRYTTRLPERGKSVI